MGLLAASTTCCKAAEMVATPRAACVLNATMTSPWELVSHSIALGALLLPPGRAAWLGCRPPQPQAGSDTGHSTLLRAVVPFLGGCASLLAFPPTGSNARRWARSWEVGEERSPGSGRADMPQAWERGNARQCPPGCGFKGGSAFFSCFPFYFKSRLSLKLNMVFWRK